MSQLIELEPFFCVQVPTCSSWMEDLSLDKLSLESLQESPVWDPKILSKLPIPENKTAAVIKVGS